MLFKTSEKDIERWKKREDFDKIADALLNNNTSIRLAAAKALHFNGSQINGHTRHKSIDYMIKSYYRNDIDEMTKMSDALYTLLVSFKQLLKVLENIKNPDIQRIIIETIGNYLELITSKEKTRECIETFKWIKEQSGLSLGMKDLLLEKIARYYLRCTEYQNISELSYALADFGPEAGKQLLSVVESFKSVGLDKLASRLRDMVIYSEKFAKEIIAGKACGSKHQLNNSCVCIICGEIIHDLDNSCICRRCGEEHHLWSQGVYNSHYRCERCGKMEHMHEHKNIWD